MYTYAHCTVVWVDPPMWYSYITTLPQDNVKVPSSNYGFPSSIAKKSIIPIPMFKCNSIRRVASKIVQVIVPSTCTKARREHWGLSQSDRTVRTITRRILYIHFWEFLVARDTCHCSLGGDRISCERGNVQAGILPRILNVYRQKCREFI